MIKRKYNTIMYAYIRDSMNNLKATVVYSIHASPPPSGDYVVYGITIVSPVESQSVIRRQYDKTHQRYQHALAGAESGWKEYAPSRGIPHTHGTYSAYNAIRKAKLNKLGALSCGEFEKALKTVKKAVSKL